MPTNVQYLTRFRTSKSNISAHLRNVIDENCLHVNRGGTRVLHGVVCRWISGRWNAIHAAPCFHVCWGVCLYVICMFAPVFVDVHKTGAVESCMKNTKPWWTLSSAVPAGSLCSAFFTRTHKRTHTHSSVQPCLSIIAPLHGPASKMPVFEMAHSVWQDDSLIVKVCSACRRHIGRRKHRHPVEDLSIRMHAPYRVITRHLARH